MIEWLLESLFDQLFQYLVNCVLKRHNKQSLTSANDSVDDIVDQTVDVDNEMLHIQVRYMNVRNKKVCCQDLSVFKWMTVQDVKQKLFKELGL